MGTGSAVMVHGAWHGPWCWEPVVGGLEEAGYVVKALELPMSSFDADVEVVQRAIATAVPPVTVVAHSYGGQVASAAAHAADRLVFVAAAAPDEGETTLGILGDAPAWLDAVDFGDGTTSRLTEEAVQYFYPCVDDDKRRWAFERLRPLAVACGSTPLAGDPAWQTVQSSYVVCAQDVVIPVDYQRSRAARMAHSVELESDHSPFLHIPEQLVAAISAGDPP